jgi:WD40 repeat protein
MATGQVRNTLEGHNEAVTSIAVIIDEQILVSGSWDKSIKVWKAE